MSGGYGTDALEMVATATAAATANSPVEICNVALLMVGAEAITDLGDSTDRARVCKALWQTVLEDEITLHRWKCCRKRVELALDAAAPAFGWSYQYALPTDCLRVLDMYPATTEHEIEDGMLLTDSSSAKIIYLYRNETVAKYSSGLKATLAARMAANIAMPLTKKKAVVDAAWSAYWSVVSQAIAADGQQGSPEVIEDRTLVDARL